MHYRSLLLGVLLIVFGAHDAASQGFISPLLHDAYVAKLHRQQHKAGLRRRVRCRRTDRRLRERDCVLSRGHRQRRECARKKPVISFSGGPILGPTIGPVKRLRRLRRRQSSSQRDGLSRASSFRIPRASPTTTSHSTSAAASWDSLRTTSVCVAIPLLPCLRYQNRRPRERRPPAGQVQFLARELRHRREILMPNGFDLAGAPKRECVTRAEYPVSANDTVCRAGIHSGDSDLCLTRWRVVCVRGWDGLNTLRALPARRARSVRSDREGTRHVAHVLLRALRTNVARARQTAVAHYQQRAPESSAARDARTHKMMRRADRRTSPRQKPANRPGCSESRLAKVERQRGSVVMRWVCTVCGFAWAVATPAPKPPRASLRPKRRRRA